LDSSGIIIAFKKINRNFSFGAFGMKKNISLLVILSFIICLPAYGAFEWKIYDFGTGPFDYNNNRSLIRNSYTYWPTLESYPMQGNGNTYVFEFEFDADLIRDFDNYNSVTFQNTLNCNNDLVEKSYPAVPEPATLILFGLGSLGLAACRKRR